MNGSYSDGGLYDYDRDETVRSITDVLQDNAESHGFVPESRVRDRYEDGEIKYIRKNGEIVAVIEYHHPKRRDHTRIYNVSCYDQHIGKGHREELVHRVMKESPYGRAITKVPMDDDQNQFWNGRGEFIRNEAGRKRRLSVYRIVANPKEGVNVLQDYEDEH